MRQILSKRTRRHVLCTKVTQTAMYINTSICKQTRTQAGNSSHQDDQLFMNNVQNIAKEDLTWNTRAFTLFYYNMHLTFDPVKHPPGHKSLSIHSPLHTGPYCVSVTAHKPFSLHTYNMPINPVIRQVAKCNAADLYQRTDRYLNLLMILWILKPTNWNIR